MLLNFSSPQSIKKRSSGSASASRIGFGPSILERSLFNLSIVFGKNNSIKVTTELASSKILLCDLKLIVNYLTTGMVINISSINSVLNNDERSQKRNPTPCAIV